MKEYVTLLEESSQSVENKAILKSKILDENYFPEIAAIEKLNIEIAPVEDSICVKDECCDVGHSYGCPTDSGEFKVENLFSELIDEYQRTVARRNLGIAEAFAMKWGNITGNLVNQKDLYNFVVTSADDKYNLLIKEINAKLSEWAYDINIKLSSKADILSPKFIGEPTVPLQSLNDSSDKIASTKWVTLKVESLLSRGDVSLAITPSYSFIGDPVSDVVCKWSYSNPGRVISQSINGINIPVNLREYTFKNVTSELSITLTYSDGSEFYSASEVYTIFVPIYYGISSNYQENSRTLSTKLTIPTKDMEYAYIMIPIKSDIEFRVGGISGGFELIETKIIHGIPYSIYRTTNSGLGNLKIEIYDYQ